MRYNAGMKTVKSSSNTAAKQKKQRRGTGPHRPPKGVIPPQLRGYQFTSGDPRINRKGRPKVHDDLRKMIVEMGNQEVDVEVGSGRAKRVERMTLFEKMLLDMILSRDPRDRQMVIEHGFGKVPDNLNLAVAKVIRVAVVKKGGSDALQEQEAEAAAEVEAPRNIPQVGAKVRKGNKA